MARKQQEPEQQTIDSDYNDADRFVDKYVASKMQTSDGMGLKYDDAQIEAWQAEAREAWSAHQDTAAAGAELEQQRADMDVWKERAATPVPFVESFQDAIEHWQDEQGGLVTVDDYEKLDNKEDLLEVPFIINKFWFSLGKVVDPATGEERETIYATMQIITEDDRKFTVTDGSTGICKQLQQRYKASGRWGGYLARKGLRVSRYPNPARPGTMAETFYLT